MTNDLLQIGYHEEFICLNMGLSKSEERSFDDLCTKDAFGASFKFGYVLCRSPNVQLNSTFGSHCSAYCASEVS